jgi:hypothetical protein
MSKLDEIRKRLASEDDDEPKRRPGRPRKDDDDDDDEPKRRPGRPRKDDVVDGVGAKR